MLYGYNTIAGPMRELLSLLLLYKRRPSVDTAQRAPVQLPQISYKASCAVQETMCINQSTCVWFCACHFLLTCPHAAKVVAARPAARVYVRARAVAAAVSGALKHGSSSSSGSGS